MPQIYIHICVLSEIGDTVINNTTNNLKELNVILSSLDRPFEHLEM